MGASLHVGHVWPWVRRRAWVGIEAMVVLQNEARMGWVQRQLGHSTITVTVDRYGRWERAAEKAEAKALEGAFPMVGASMSARTSLSP